MIDPVNKKILKAGNYFFLLLFVVLSYHNRLAIDDFHSLYNIKNYTVIDATVYEYSNGSSRWVAVFLSHLVVSFYENPVFLFEFHILSLILLFISTRWLIINLNKSFSFPLFAGKDHTALFLINALFYSTIGIGETWFWISSACTYLINTIAIIAAAAWITDKSGSILKYFIGIISFIIIGGTLESSVVFLVFLFPVIIILNKIKPGIQLSSIIDFRKYVTGTIFMLVSFYFLYTGTAMEKRMSFFEQHGFFESLLLNFKTTGMIILLKLPMILPFIFLFTFPFIAFSDSVNKINSLKLFLNSLVISGLLIFIYQFPVTYKTNDVAANRTLITIVLLLIALSVYTFYHAGKKINLSPVVRKNILFVSFSAITLLNLFQLVNQYIITSQYSVAYDERMQLLESRKAGALIELDPLPESGMLYSAEISKDTSDFTNYFLAQGMELKGSVKLKD